MTQCWLRSLSTIALCLIFCGLLSVDADCQVNRVGGTTLPGKKAVGAIVFVHGITGNSVDTFTADNGSYWPRMLLSDPRPLSSGRTLGSYDIFTLDYETSIGSQYNVRNVSIAVKLWIDNSRLLRDYENIIFVCHSLGGLIIMNVLSELGLESGEYQKIAGIALLGTPAKGSSIADGSTLTTLEAAQAAIKFVLSKLERKTVDLRPVYDNTYLQEVNGKWRNALARRAASRRPALACAHETSETFGHWVVRQELAADFCDAESFPMPLNHLQLVKPSGHDVLNHVWFRQFMDRIDATISIKPSEVVNSVAPSKSDRVESPPSTKYQCPSLSKHSGMMRLALQACRKESLSNPNSAEIALERARMEFAAGYNRSTRLYLKKAAALGSREAARALKLLFPGGELVKPQSVAAAQALRKQAGDLGFRNPAAIKMLPRKPAVKSVASKVEEGVSAEALQMNKQKDLVAKISAELKRIGCWSGASAGTEFKLGSSGNVLFDGPIKLVLERLRERNPSVRSNVPHEDTLAIIMTLPTGGGC